jgi:deoxyadenosine/deoxycytidine kinase
MEDPRYIVIEGPIGVGKTSLAKLLSEELNARLVLEKIEDNPFLKEFYRNPKQFAFQTQVFFLLSRYRQLEALAQMDIFSKSTISDYFFPKDRIFASITLEESELTLYEQIYNLLNPRIPVPDLVVYLQAGTPMLLQRIRHRGRDYETGIAADYLERLNQAYNQFFFHYSDSPLLVVQTGEIDFVKSREDRKDLLRQIRQMKKGTQYYIPRK